MKIIKSLFLLCILSIVLNGCSSFSEAGKILRNEKSRTIDEFLIKKQQPLTQPPDFETIPEPGSIGNKEKDNIEKILKTPQTKSSTSQSKSSSIEESILNQIKK